MKLITKLTLLAACMFLGCGKKDQSKLVTHQFTKEKWLAGIVNGMAGFKLHLNNYTPRKHEFEQDDNFAYQMPNSSQITLGTVSLPFDIPVTRQDPYSIYISDVNSARIGTDAHDGVAYVKLQFEDGGTEIFGDCVNNVICICGSPKLDLSDITALIPLVIGASNGAATITAQDATFASGITESGPCVDNACAFLCDIMAPNKNSDMQKAIGKFITDFANQHSGLIAGTLNQYLKQLGVTGAIVSIKIDTNGDLIVVDKE